MTDVKWDPIGFLSLHIFIVLHSHIKMASRICSIDQILMEKVDIFMNKCPGKPYTCGSLWLMVFYGHFCACDRLIEPSNLQRLWSEVKDETPQMCQHWDSNSGGSDLWSNMLPVRPQRCLVWKCIHEHHYNWDK